MVFGFASMFGFESSALYGEEVRNPKKSVARATYASVLLIMGFCGILFMAGSNTTLQLTVPDELRGRVMSLYTFVFAGVTPFGSLLVGAIAEKFGIRTSLVVASTAGVVSVLALLLWWNGRERGPSLTAPRQVEGPA